MRSIQTEVKEMVILNLALSAAYPHLPLPTYARFDPPTFILQPNLLLSWMISESRGE